MAKVKEFLKHSGWILLLDVLAMNGAYLLTLYIRFYVNGAFRDSCEFYLVYFRMYAPFYTVGAVILFKFFRLYGGIWRYAGMNDMNRIVIGNAATLVWNIVISIVVIALSPLEKKLSNRMPVSYYLIGGALQLALTGLTRFIIRIFHEEKLQINKKADVNVMLIGIGETGRIVRKQMEGDPENAARIACIFSYRDTTSGAMMDGIPVVSDLEKLKVHIRKYQVQRVILADSIMPMSVREQIKTTCQEIHIEVQDFSGFLRYDNSALPFQKLMECVSGPVDVLCDGEIWHYDNGEQAVMTLVGKHDVRSVSIREDCLFVELISYQVNPLVVFYITNRPDVALVAEKYGVDRIWVDLEVRGKVERQRNLNSVKSNHSISDISAIKPLLTQAEMLVRVNSWYEGSQQEIDDVIAAGADIIMLPYWKTPEEVTNFLQAVHHRCRTSLLLETKEAVECIDEVLKNGGFDEIHIGLNDLHLSYGMTFMFEPLANGTVEMLCNKFKQRGIPYGFGGIAKIGDGILPAERIIMEHYRLGSTRAILSRTFCDCSKIEDIDEIEMIFRENMAKLREFELSMANTTQEEYTRNKVVIAKTVDEIVDRINQARSNGL